MTSAKRKERMTNILFFGMILVGLGLLVALAAPRFTPNYTPKDALVEHLQRQTLPPTNAQTEDSPETIAQLKACEAAGLVCDWDGDEVIGTPTTTTSSPAPTGRATSAPAQPSPRADLTVSTESRDQRSTQPAPPPNGGTVPDASVPSTTSTNDCTTHGDPFSAECAGR